jgi:1-aminocyclopropane-1-carboxylate deaminase/D-cysteine desulfhydrase-like pyridoxal-dependent ACC family enzyme
VTGISVDLHAEPLKEKVAALATETANLLHHPHQFDTDEVDVRDAYLGGGYGILGDLEREAIETFARLEGVLLDPVYTGRAAGGMMDLIHRGEIGSHERVLFWQTGGTPALFAYAEGLI